MVTFYLFSITVLQSLDSEPHTTNQCDKGVTMFRTLVTAFGVTFVFSFFVIAFASWGIEFPSSINPNNDYGCAMLMILIGSSMLSGASIAFAVWAIWYAENKKVPITFTMCAIGTFVLIGTGYWGWNFCDFIFGPIGSYQFSNFLFISGVSSVTATLFTLISFGIYDKFYY